MGAPHPLHLLVRNLALRCELSEHSRDAILALPFTERILEPLSYVVREADEPAFCGVLLSGYAYRQKTTDDGAKQILAVLMPGDAVDLQHVHMGVADHSVQMLTRGTVAQVPISEMVGLLSGNDEIARAIMLNILAEASIFREWIVNVGRRNGKERIAHLLCEFGARHDAMALVDGGMYEFPMTQEDLGNAVGLSSVHVNRSLKALEEISHIKRGRGTIRFDGWKEMRESCGFNRRYLHLNPDLPYDERHLQVTRTR